MQDDNATRRRFLQTGIAVGALGMAGCLGDDVDEEDVDLDDEANGEGDPDADYEVRVGTSSGGTFDVGLAFEQAVSEHSDTVAYSTIESPGYVGTTYRMDEGAIDAGLIDTNTMDKARTHRDMFEEDPVDTIPWQGFQGFPYSIYLVARADAGIETFDDLAGASVYPAEPGYSTRATSLEVWEQEPTRDVYEQMDIIDMDVDDAPGAMEEGNIDAAIAYGTPGVGNTGWVVEYDARVDVQYVQHTDALVESIQTFDGAGFSEYDDVQEEFQWQQDIGADEVVAWDLNVTFAFRHDTPSEAVYELTRIADEHGDAVRDAEKESVLV